MSTSSISQFKPNQEYKDRFIERQFSRAYLSYRWRSKKSNTLGKAKEFLELRRGMMMCQVGAGIMPIYGQKLSLWVGTLGWVARNTEVRIGKVLAQSVQVGGVSQLVQR